MTKHTTHEVEQTGQIAAFENGEILCEQIVALDLLKTMLKQLDRVSDELYAVKNRIESTENPREMARAMNSLFSVLAPMQSNLRLDLVADSQAKLMTLAARK